MRTSIFPAQDAASPLAMSGRNQITLAELCEHFLSEYRRPRIKDMTTYRRTVRSILRQRVLSEPLAGKGVTELRPRDFEALRDSLVQRAYENSSINQTLKLLSTIYNWGQRSDLFDGRNPLSVVERMPEYMTAGHYSALELARILTHPHCSTMVATAVYTGMRKGELYGLRWQDVSLDEACITVERSYHGTPKSGQARLIPIHPELLPLLRVWRQQSPQTPLNLVFPVALKHGYGMGRSDDGRELSQLLHAVGVPVCHRPWHAFRHSFATLLCEAGAARDAIERLLGHATTGSRITARYLHPSLGYLRRELHKLSLGPASPIA